MTDMADDIRLDREMGYTDWASSCRSPHPDPDHPDVVCRRIFSHKEGHASGFGKNRLRWEGRNTRFEFPVIPIAQRKDHD